jgi:hypothetical protein
VPAGFAISSEAPVCSRRARLPNYKQTRRKKSSLPVLNPDVEVSVWSDDGISTIHNDENDGCQEESVDVDNVYDNGLLSVKMASYKH